MPLHVAISDAILGRRQGTRAAARHAAILSRPGASRSCCRSRAACSMPAASTRRRSDLLSAKGVRFAAEGWNEAGDIAASIAVEGLDFLKIPANRLLDRERQRPQAGPGLDDHRKRRSRRADDHRDRCRQRRGRRQPDRSRHRPDGRSALRRPEAAEARRRQQARPARADLTGRAGRLAHAIRRLE